MSIFRRRNVEDEGEEMLRNTAIREGESRSRARTVGRGILNIQRSLANIGKSAMGVREGRPEEFRPRKIQEARPPQLEDYVGIGGGKEGLNFKDFIGGGSAKRKKKNERFGGFI